jgi:excisionase family DNA binding protein
MESGRIEQAPRRKSHTYLPTDESRDEIVDLAKFFSDLEQFLGARRRPALKGPDGVERELPQELFEVLEQVVTALANGNGVTIAPYGMLLTTQEAADYLGISRPTLVKLLVTGSIAHEMRGRHRRVMLRDLVDYQERSKIERRATLREMAKVSQRNGTSELPSGGLRRTNDGV